MTQVTRRTAIERQPIAKRLAPGGPTIALPDARGHFGPYGGSFVAETLTHALDELNEAYAHYQNDPEFLAEFDTN